MIWVNKFNDKPPLNKIRTVYIIIGMYSRCSDNTQLEGQLTDAKYIHQ